MGYIKEYKQLTHVTLKDGRVITSESTPEEIGSYIDEHYHILIEGELHSRFDIVNAVPARLDNVEGLILSQSKEMQQQIRAKIRERKEEL
jgi:hypothetical protein